jgi:hypothetical protein
VISREHWYDMQKQDCKEGKKSMIWSVPDHLELVHKNKCYYTQNIAFKGKFTCTNKRCPAKMNNVSTLVNND